MVVDRRTLAPVVIATLVLLSGCSVLPGSGTPTANPDAGSTPTATGTATPVANSTSANGTATATERRTATPTATPTPTALPTPTKPSPTGIRVSKVVADPPGPDEENLAEEYIVLKNTGDNPVDLEGWSVKDEDGHVHTFQEGVRLEVGETLTLHTGSGSQTENHRYWWAGEPVWDNDGETVFVFDETGQKVFERTYE